MKTKFRVWNEKTESFINYGDLMLDLKNGKVYSGDVGIPEYTIDVTNQVILMQSTGLKDKNGVEIFEGDVISELSEQGEDWANHILAEVVWHKAGFYGKEKGHEPEYPITEFIKGEVIGNIYKNSELLEVAE